MRIVAHPTIAALADGVRAACRLFGRDVERFHELGRPREELVRAIERAVDERRDALDAVCLHIAALEGLAVDDARHLVVQRAAYGRVMMPADAGMPFHIDRYTGQVAPSQRAIWIPLVDVRGPEGLWLVDDEVMRAALARGPLADQQNTLRAHARPIAVRAGEALVFAADTGHGSVMHHLDVTRASFDVRIASADEAPKGRFGWRSRPLKPAGALGSLGSVGAPGLVRGQSHLA